MSRKLVMQNQEVNQHPSWHELRQLHYEDLMACAGQAEDFVWLAQIIASWQVGIGALPDYLGLSYQQFHRLMQSCFPGYYLSGKAYSGIQLDFSRMLEKQELEAFLQHYAIKQHRLRHNVINFIITACLGNDHLWQDLGLWSRNDLSLLMQRFFPELKLMNSKDMKWKKFIYKQLCEAEGIYVCRAPSCEVCKDYPNCFGAEE